jgi:hypothetical protein
VAPPACSRGAAGLAWPQPLFGVEYDLANGVPWALSLLSSSLVTAWMWLHTGGILLLPMLLHAATNTVTFAWGWFVGADQLQLWWIWTALWAAAAVVVVSTTGPELTRHITPTRQPGIRGLS